MKTLLTIFLSFSTLLCLSQTNESEFEKTDTVTILVKVKLENATKDGLYIQGGILDLDAEEIERLNGKTIRVTGIKTRVKGLKNLPKAYDKNGNEIVQQGREEDFWHFHSIKYIVVNDNP